MSDASGATVTEREILYRAVFESATVGQALVAIDGRFEEVNRAFTIMLGYEASELCNKTFAEITHPEDVAESVKAVEGLVRGDRSAFRMEKRYLRKDGSLVWADVNVGAIRDSAGNIAHFITHIIDISDRKRIEQELQLRNLLLSTQQEASIDGILVVDEAGEILSFNKQFTVMWGIPADILALRSDDRAIAVVMDKLADPKQFIEKVRYLYAQQRETSLDEIALKDGRAFERYSAPMIGEDQKYYGRVWYFRDVTNRKKMELELHHAQKLEAVGRLASGIAHEINTPMQFVGDSVHFLKDAWDSASKLIPLYQRAVDALAAAGIPSELVDEIKETETEVDLDYVIDNVPSCLERSLDGVSRVSTIVRAMKEFAHPSQREKSSADLNQHLQSTLIIAKNEYKYAADVETDLGEIPPVLCYPQDLNQVFLNLIVNAAHAIAAVMGDSGNKGLIRIKTSFEDGLVRIVIADNGGGIPASIRHRIFEPFFTTKEIGKGTGQGLTIARTIVVEKHGGTLNFESEEGKGTTFTIRLPVDGGAGVKR